MWPFKRKPKAPPPPLQPQPDDLQVLAALRRMGALRVHLVMGRVVEVRFQEPPPAPPPPQPPETEAELRAREKREAAEREETLYWSSGATGPAKPGK
jgi:hypothetical protein